MQRCRALATQPWRHATGPRSPEGRARSAQNARYKDARLVLMRSALKRQSIFLRWFRAASFTASPELKQEGWAVIADLLVVTRALDG